MCSSKAKWHFEKQRRQSGGDTAQVFAALQVQEVLSVGTCHVAQLLVDTGDAKSKQSRGEQNKIPQNCTLGAQGPCHVTHGLWRKSYQALLENESDHSPTLLHSGCGRCSVVRAMWHSAH
jgi:hypothetical protein